MASIFLRSVVVAAISCAVTYVNAAASPVCARHYTVQPGDICSTISIKQHVSTFQLQSVNAGVIDSQCLNLIPGESLCLGLVGQDCTDLLVVADGDNCFDIGLKLGIPVSTILANNPNVNAQCTNIFINESLCVDSNIIKYTTPTF